MQEALKKMYEEMNEASKKELYDFALFLLSRNEKQSSSDKKESMYGVWKNDTFV